MEEINIIKKRISSIKVDVPRILQECESWERTGQERSRRIQDLEISIQRLTHRLDKGDNDFQTLECMVHDLGAKLERAYHLSVGRLRAKHLGVEDNDKAPSNIQNNTSSLDSTIKEHENKARTTYAFQNNVHAQQSSNNNTENHSHRQLMICSDDLDTSIVELAEASNSHDHGSANNSRELKGGNIERLHITEEKPLHDKQYRRTLTTVADDNTLSYRRKLNVNRHRIGTIQKDNMQLENNIVSTDNISDNESVENEVFIDLTRTLGNGDEVANDVLASDNVTINDTEIPRQSLETNGQVVKIETTRSSTEKAQGSEITEEKLCLQQDKPQSMVRNSKDSVEWNTLIKKLTDRVKTEILKGEAEKRSRWEGLNTVLCLDTSASMEGAAFEEMISVALRFVDGIQIASRRLEMKENIGVSTFGKNSSVLLHLTNEYDKVKEVLMSLKPEGPSPMLTGIYMALAACKGNAGSATLNGLHICGRIILISDGKGTPDQWRLSEDIVDNNDPKTKYLVNSNIVTAGKMAQSSGNAVYVVPVGDYLEGPLERVARLSGGEVIRSHELSRLIQYNELLYAAGEYTFEGLTNGQHNNMEAFLRYSLGITATAQREQNFDQKRMDVLTLALKLSDRMQKMITYKSEGGAVIIDYEEVNSYMPYLGSRVRLNHNLKQSTHMKTGTVVNHYSDRKVEVQWDCGCNDYHRYVLGIHDVIVIDEERELPQGFCAIGCKVKRGSHWMYGDDDGGVGSVGVIFLTDDKGYVGVRWPNNKNLKTYRYGAVGRFEVERIPRQHTSDVPVSILPPKTQMPELRINKRILFYTNVNTHTVLYQGIFCLQERHRGQWRV